MCIRDSNLTGENLGQTSSELLNDILRKEGLRYTKQRQAVWDEIKKSDDHRDAEDIYIQLKSNNQLINVNLPIEDLKVFKKGDYVDIQFPKESAQVID